MTTPNAPLSLTEALAIARRRFSGHLVAAEARRLPGGWRIPMRTTGGTRRTGALDVVVADGGASIMVPAGTSDAIAVRGLPMPPT